MGNALKISIENPALAEEIGVVLREFLLRTRNARIVGAAPFVAFMLARTLRQLPVAFEPAQIGCAVSTAAD